MRRPRAAPRRPPRPRSGPEADGAGPGDLAGRTAWSRAEAAWSPRPHPTIVVMSVNPLRELPSVDALLRSAEGAAMVAEHGHEATVEALRAALADARERGTPRDASELVGDARARLERPPSLRRVLNATGVIVHTNLGRAPLADAAVRRV